MNTELLKLRILVAVQDQKINFCNYAKVKFILMPPPHFHLVPRLYVCSGNGTDRKPTFSGQYIR